MLLYEGFISLFAPTTPLSFRGLMLKRSDLELAEKKIVSSYRCLADSAKKTAYDNYLAYCAQAMTGLDERSFLDVLINYLVDVNDLNDRDACEKLTQIFSLSFTHQQDALSIAPMGLVFVDPPKAFAAFVRYLLQRGVTIEQLFSTYLLQNYFRYYSVQQANNPIEELYNLFQSFNDSELIVDAAKHICCAEKGLSSYALDGSIQHTPGSLTPVNQIHTPMLFTADQGNLQALHHVFGVDFLMGALFQWNTLKDDPIWVSAIAELFNQPYTVKTQLHRVVNRIHEHATLPAILARILSDQTLSILVERHVVGVLHLIPFCPILVHLVQTHDLPAYLHVLRQQNTPGAALISSLFVLFNQIKNSNPAAASLIFDALLDAVHDDTNVLEDNRMIEQLGKFLHFDACINQQVRAFEAELDTVIHLQTQSSIQDMDYIPIEDIWRVVCAKIRNLKYIVEHNNTKFKYKCVEFNTTCPMDKYKLYSRIASALMTHQDSAFDLHAFARMLEVDPVFEVANITAFERLVIELLATLDNNALRRDCIQILDANVQRPWRQFSYGGSCLFKQATLAGNLGLIRWMTAMKINTPDSYDVLALDAAKANQWPVVTHFHMTQKLKQNTVNQLLSTAVAQGRLREVAALWTGNYARPTMKAFESAFKLATDRNDPKSLRCFIDAPQKPCDAVIASAFRHAIELKHYYIASVIAENFTGTCLLDTIEETLNHAVRKNQHDVLNLLSALRIERPAQKVIENALISAIRANQLVSLKWLVGFSPVSIRPEIIKEARKEAHKKNLTEIESYLLTLSNPLNIQPISFVQKNTHRKTTLMNQPMRRTASCNAMSPVRDQGLFRKSASTLSTDDYVLTELTRIRLF